MEVKMWLAYCVVDGDAAVAVVLLAAHKRDDSRRGLTPILYTGRCCGADGKRNRNQEAKKQFLSYQGVRADLILKAPSPDIIRHRCWGRMDKLRR